MHAGDIELLEIWRSEGLTIVKGIVSVVFSFIDNTQFRRELLLLSRFCNTNCLGLVRLTISFIKAQTGNNNPTGFTMSFYRYFILKINP